MSEYFTNSKQNKFKVLAPARANFNYVRLNTNRLSFLPSLFISFLSLVAVVWLFIYFNPIGLFTRNPQIAGVEEKISLDQSDLKLDNASEINNQPSSLDKSVLITKGSSSCKLNYPINFNLPVTALIKKDKQSWWLPAIDNCSDSNIQAVQIVQLSNEEGLQVKVGLNPSNIFLISAKDNIYALVYTKDKQISSYNFSEFGENLLEPTFASSKTFDALKMYDTKIVDNWSYQLSVGCQAKSVEDNCIIWKQNQYSGVVYKLKPDLYLDLQNLSLPYNKEKSYLKFAKKQDSNSDINLIFGNLEDSDYFLIKLGVKSNSISSASKYSLSDPDYNSYFR